MAYADPVKLTGQTVRLEPMRVEHTEGLFAASDERIWDYLPTEWPTTVEEMRAWIDGALELQTKGARVPFTVIDAASDRVIGSTSYLDISEPDRHLEIGWTWYNPGVWRSGSIERITPVTLETLGASASSHRLRNERLSAPSSASAASGGRCALLQTSVAATCAPWFSPLLSDERPARAG